VADGVKRAREAVASGRARQAKLCRGQPSLAGAMTRQSGRNEVGMSDILQRIVAVKVEEVAALRPRRAQPGRRRAMRRRSAADRAPFARRCAGGGKAGGGDRRDQEGQPEQGRAA
jgi:hypothetical protein